MLLVVSFALAAAALFAMAAILQQRGAQLTGAGRSVEGAGRLIRALPVLARVRVLVTNPVWLLGWAADVGGFVCQATALHLGSVAAVQPLLVTQLVFVVLLSAAYGRRRVRARDVAGAAAIAAGVALFLLSRQANPGTDAADRLRVGIVLILGLGATAVLVLASVGRAPATRAGLLGVGAGLCAALAAVLMTLTAADLTTRGLGTAFDWVGWGLAAVTVVQITLSQQAFAIGPLAVSQAAITIVDPIASYCAGVFAFRHPFPSDAPSLAAIAAAGALIIVGVITLAPSVPRPD